MKKILTVAALMMVMLLPAFAQGQRMSTEDQGKFDSYYSRWQQYRQSNDRDQVSSMEKRAVFKSAWLPYALIFPQIVVTILFFFWPAAQAVYQSLQVQDAFGTQTEFVWLDNFRDLFHDELEAAIGLPKQSIRREEENELHGLGRQALTKPIETGPVGLGPSDTEVDEDVLEGDKHLLAKRIVEERTDLVNDRVLESGRIACVGSA